MPIGNCVYLDFLLSRVMQFKINYIFLSLYYNHELFLDYLKVTDYTDYIEPIIEPEPLGTGGAINYVIENTTISSPFFVINGDSISNINLNQMLKKFDDANMKSMVGISRVDEATRYGTVLENDGEVVSFKEKGLNGAGWINNGHYIFKKEAFDEFNGIFSLENDLFPKLLQKKELGAFRVANDNFIDMGIPEEYLKLNKRSFINYEDEKNNT